MKKAAGSATAADTANAEGQKTPLIRGRQKKQGLLGAELKLVQELGFGQIPKNDHRLEAG